MDVDGDDHRTGSFQPRGSSSGIDVVLATGGDTAAAARSALAATDLSWVAAIDGDLVLLVPERAVDPGAADVAAVLTARTRAAVRTVRPLSLAAAALRPRSSWRDVEVGQGAERFDRIRAPRDLVTAGGRVLVGVLPVVAAERQTGPLGTLAAYAHPRQRLAARLAPDARPTADLAFPLRPRLVVLGGRIGGRPLAVATADLIAAELIWLALRPERADEDAVGPWEDAAVQRATELELGVRLPAQLRIEAVSGADSGANRFLSDLADDLRLCLGIPST